MTYLDVLVADPTYHGATSLTYSAAKPLPAGTIVQVFLRDKQVLGVVWGPSAKRPRFEVKEILAVPDLPCLPAMSLRLLDWMIDYYPAPLGALVQHFLPSKHLPAKLPTPFVPQKPTPSSLSLPTADQMNALKIIDEAGLYILHGDTGSGKTLIYIKLALKSLEKGKSAVILTPEIGLTSQLAREFYAIFGDRVVIIHSQLADSERRKIWLQLLVQQEPMVVIGPRSALFVPLRKIGLIVLDESHEAAYKQDQAPYYQASHVAGRLAQLHDAPLILGSATPAITDYYVATQKKRPIIRMQQLATTHAAASRHISIVDIRDRREFKRSSFVSEPLLKTIEGALKNRAQTLLFLNRRGSARVVFCETCGWQSLCPHCDMPLIYHADTHVVRCHVCNFHDVAPVSCPACGHPSVVYKGIGTKTLFSEMQALFPEAVIQRFDTDNKKAERIEKNYADIRSGKIDILIGTQTLAKGLDLPKLEVVGIVMADTGLSMPDFTSSERTYQMLNQVIGRVGRGHGQNNQVVVQTYSPDNPILRAAITNDWENFYNEELSERRKFSFPPFRYLLRLSCRRTTSSAAQRTAEKLFSTLAQKHTALTLEGPAPAFHAKVSGKYEWQIVVKATYRPVLIEIIRALPSGWSYDIDPINLL